MRDVNLNRLGWIVVRFTEKQIYTQSNECINYILKLIHSIDTSFVISAEYNSTNLIEEKRWSDLQSRIWEKEKYREGYLDHEFSKIDTPKEDEVFIQNEQEKKYSEKLEKIYLQKEEIINIDNSPLVFKQDKDITFEPNEHIYLYKGSIEFTPVSTIVSKFFKPFDANYWAERKANNFEEYFSLLEEWDYNGCLSRETGVFLHKQIENYFAKKNCRKYFSFQIFRNS